MIGLDTNVLVRILVQDDSTQSRKAREFIDRLSVEEPGYVNLLTLVEVSWVLERRYGFSRQKLVAAVIALLQTREMVIEREHLVWSAVQTMQQSRIELSDALISAINAQAGCSRTMTFDRTFAASGYAELP